MGIEVWIVLLLLASGASAWIGYTFARRNGPSQADVDALEAELDAARQQAEAVQVNVNEHFEQSAVLFGRLAKDYREFLDHFSSSAQSLGLSEGQARDLLEQGFQPMLTDESEAEDLDQDAVEAPDLAAADDGNLADDADLTAETSEDTVPVDEPILPPTLESVVEEPTARVSDVVVDMPEDGASRDDAPRDDVSQDDVSQDSVSQDLPESADIKQANP